MANGMYAKAKQAFLNAEIDTNTHTIKACLVASEHYTPNLATDDALADIAEVGGTTGALQNPTIVDGVFDADNITISALTYGHVIDYIVVYDDSHADKILIALFDTATGLPLTTNGTDVTLTFNASGIFKLGA